MTAVSLFDTLARQQAGPAMNDAELMSRRTALAEKLVASALADLQRAREYEQLLKSGTDGAGLLAGSLLESVGRLYGEWADEADQVVARVRSLGSQGAAIPGVSQLDDAIGRTRARLNVLPALLAGAIEQAHQGQFVPAKELRDELRARIRT